MFGPQLIRGPPLRCPAPPFLFLPSPRYVCRRPHEPVRTHQSSALPGACTAYERIRWMMRSESDRRPAWRAARDHGVTREQRRQRDAGDWPVATARDRFQRRAQETKPSRPGRSTSVAASYAWRSDLLAARTATGIDLQATHRYLEYMHCMAASLLLPATPKSINGALATRSAASGTAGVRVSSLLASSRTDDRLYTYGCQWLKRAGRDHFSHHTAPFHALKVRRM